MLLLSWVPVEFCLLGWYRLLKSILCDLGLTKKNRFLKLSKSVFHESAEKPIARKNEVEEL